MITITNTIIFAIITIAISTIGPEYPHIHPQLVGSKLQSAVEYLSWTSALSNIQLSTSLAESQTADANTMTVRHREISSRWSHQHQEIDYDINQWHDFSHGHTPATICQLSANSRHLPPGAWGLQIWESLDRGCRGIFRRSRPFHGKLLDVRSVSNRSNTVE